jgi:hypothetical protein
MIDFASIINMASLAADGCSNEPGGKWGEKFGDERRLVREYGTNGIRNRRDEVSSITACASI